MVYFPERQPDGSWMARKLFTKRDPRTADFTIDGDEFELYRDVTSFVKEQSSKAAAKGDDPRARAVGFLMALYQRRLASSAYALRHSLENRARRLTENLKRAHEIALTAPPDLPDPEDMEEMEEAERDRIERAARSRHARPEPDAGARGDRRARGTGRSAPSALKRPRPRQSSRSSNGSEGAGILRRPG